MLNTHDIEAIGKKEIYLLLAALLAIAAGEWMPNAGVVSVLIGIAGVCLNKARHEDIKARKREAEFQVMLRKLERMGPGPIMPAGPSPETYTNQVGPAKG